MSECSDVSSISVPLQRTPPVAPVRSSQQSCMMTTSPPTTDYFCMYSRAVYSVRPDEIEARASWRRPSTACRVCPSPSRRLVTSRGMPSADRGAPSAPLAVNQAMSSVPATQRGGAGYPLLWSCRGSVGYPLLRVFQFSNFRLWMSLRRLVWPC